MPMDTSKIRNPHESNIERRRRLKNESARRCRKTKKQQDEMMKMILDSNDQRISQLQREVDRLEREVEQLDLKSSNNRPNRFGDPF